MAHSLPGSSIHGIFQARVLEWGAIAFSDLQMNRMETCKVSKLNIRRLSETQFTQSVTTQESVLFTQYQYSGWRRQWHSTPVLLPGKSHGRRSLVGCSPWGREELDMTERLDFHFSLSCIGEGNGNLLQCSCLENPRDRGAWWAAVCGVAHD